MKKIEAVFTHQLVAFIHNQLQEDGILDPDVQTRHKQIEAAPTDIHGTKSDHISAIQAINKDIIDAFESDTTEQTIAPIPN